MHKKNPGVEWSGIGAFIRTFPDVECLLYASFGLKVIRQTTLLMRNFSDGETILANELTSSSCKGLMP